MSDKTSGPYRICIEDSDEDVERIEGLNRAYAAGLKANKARIAERVKEAVKIEAEKITEHYDRIIDNRVNKAVEEFRERALIVIQDGWKNVPDGSGDCSARIMGLEAQIRSLPTDPEKKGEE